MRLRAIRIGTEHASNFVPHRGCCSGHRRPARVVRLVRNLSRVADHGLAPYHSVNNGRIHKSPEIYLLHPLNLVVCVDNEVFYLFGRFSSRSWPFREVSFAAVGEQTCKQEPLSSFLYSPTPPRPLTQLGGQASLSKMAA